MSEHNTVVVSSIPGCNFCRKPGVIDGRTLMGPWANMCESHHKLYGVGLGMGKGQRRILRSAVPKNSSGVSFERWMIRVNAGLVSLLGLSSEDMADRPYRDYYDAGKTPRDAAFEIYEEVEDGEL